MLKFSLFLSQPPQPFKPPCTHLPAFTAKGCANKIYIKPTPLLWETIPLYNVNHLSWLCICQRVVLFLSQQCASKRMACSALDRFWRSASTCKLKRSQVSDNFCKFQIDVTPGLASLFARASNCTYEDTQPKLQCNWYDIWQDIIRTHHMTCHDASTWWRCRSPLWGRLGQDGLQHHVHPVQELCIEHRDRKELPGVALNLAPMALHHFRSICFTCVSYQMTHEDSYHIKISCTSLHSFNSSAAQDP